MQHASIGAFFSKAKQHLQTKGPYAIILLEDAAEVYSTIEHIRDNGFSEVMIFGAKDLMPREIDGVHQIIHDMHQRNAMCDIVNAAIRALPGAWLHYCFNAEYLFFPFSESRNVGELIAFNTEERRDTVLTYVIDLYSNDLGKHPNAVSRETAYLDRSGYYALARFEDGQPLERQLDFYGGLRWRYEEHVPWDKRKIDRVSLFKAVPGLVFREDHTFNLPEYNTYECPWHHNISASLVSFRTAKALMSNPGSMYDIPHFWWDNSTRFEWTSQQLLELGLMEPGQWF